MKGANINRRDFEMGYLSQTLRTVRMIRAFQDEDLDLRPGPGSMSTAEQINHIAQTHHFLRGLFSEEEVTPKLFDRDFDVSTVAAAVTSLKQVLGEARSALNNMPAGLWEQEVEPFGAEWRMQRSQLALVMLNHETHHAGQLHVYLRVAGKQPPVLYHPVDESVLEI